VRTRRWRYIRYNNGAEELYDHDRDPHEWENLAAQLGHDEIKHSLREIMRKMQGEMKTHARPKRTGDWFKAVDADKDNSVTLDEWLAWCKLSDQRNGRLYDEALRKQTFASRDQDKSGSLSRAELERAAR
jgi:Ca2+-binding EF-hand superfamily protein